MFVTLLGRPGAGKTKLARALGNATGLPYIGGGALLRTWVDQEREGWEEVKWHLDTRTDTPTTVQLRLLRETIEGAPGAILDGFPKVAALLDDVQEVLREEIALGIYLEAPAELASYRISHRLICSVCGVPTSDLVDAPDGSCRELACGGRLIRRAEDRGVSHERETVDSVALRDSFARAGRLLVLAAGTTVAERVHGVLGELERRGINFRSNSGDITLPGP
jgi:adenylate kinase family enzyme